MFERLKGLREEGSARYGVFARVIAFVAALCTMLMLGLIPSSSALALESSVNAAVEFEQYITNAVVSKLENGSWVPVTSVTDGDGIQVSIDYTMPAGTVTGENQEITYQLPAGVKPIQDESGTVYQSNTPVGTYTIGTDGKITITFNDNFATGEAFSGNITFQGTAEKQGSGDSSDIDFGGNTGKVTIEKRDDQNDLTVTKTASHSRQDGDKVVISYTVTASTVNGTGSGSVTLKDQLKNVTGGTATYDKRTIKVVKVSADGTVSDVNISGKVSDTNDASNNNLPGFTVDNLPELGAGEKYVLTYDVVLDGTAGDGKGTVDNYAEADGGHSHGNTWHTETIESLIQKSGRYDSTKDLIAWTITVNNSGCTTSGNIITCSDLNGEKVTDTLLTEGTDIQGDVDITGSDGSKRTISAQEFKNNGYTFPAGSTAKTYTITYQTNAPQSEAGSPVQVKNQATIDKPGEGDDKTSTGTVDVTKRDWGVSKSNDGSETDRADGKTDTRWNANVTIPASWKTLTFTDTITNAVDKATGTDQGEGTHYAIATEVQQAIEQNLSMTLSDGSKLDYAALNKQFNISVTYADKDGNTVAATDGTTQVKSFSITVTPKRTDKDGNAIVANADGETVAASGLSLSYTTVIDYSGIATDTTWTFKNTAQVGGHHADATHDHTKDKPLEKMVGTVDGNGNVSYLDHSGNTKVDYDKTNGILYYQLLVRTDKTTKGKITVTDTLPKGATLVQTDNNSPVAQFYKDQYNQTDQWETWNPEYKKYVLKDHFKVSVGNQNADDGTTPVTFTIDDGYNDNGELHTIAIRYAVSIKDDDFWNDLSHTTNSYTNKAEWGSDSDETHTEVDRTVEDLKKSGEQVKGADGRPTNQVRYTVAINPAGKDLDPDSDTLTLTDTMSGVPGDGDAYIDTNTLDLYEYHTDADGKLDPTTKIDTSRYAVKYDTANHTLTVRIPDQLACILVYTYTIDAGSAESPTLSNTVNLNGGTSSSTETKIDTSSSSATVNRGKFTLYKVDGTNYNKLLSGATFTVYAYDAGTKQWGNGVMATTGADGSITFDIAATNTEFACPAGDGTTPPNCTLKPNTLYKIEETEAPDGYAKDTAAKYLIWKGKGTDGKVLADDAAYRAATGGSDAITDGDAKVEQKNVTFYNANGTNSMFVENEYNRLAVKKTWVNAAGNAIDAPVDNIQVQLMQQKTKKDGHTVTVTFNPPTNISWATAITKSAFVRNGANVSLHINTVNTNLTFPYSGTDYQASNGTVTIPLGIVTKDLDIQIAVKSADDKSWWGMDDVAFDGTEDIPYIADGSPTVYETVTLSKTNDWSHYWDGLPKKDAQGNPYLYTVTELGNKYDVTYTNNGGIQTGEIGITNKVTSVTLPSTGGTGSEAIVGGGLLLTTIAIGGLSLSLRRRRL